MCRPDPEVIPDDEVHVYTDGSASIRRGQWGTGSGVWFGEKPDFNISAIPPERQTNNRAELTVIILAVRKVIECPSEINCLVVYSDSRFCVDGINN